MAQLAANVIVLASLYILLATGYVVVYRASRILNFAHGDLMMLGGYFLFTLAAINPGHLGVNAASAVALSLLAGTFIYYVMMRPMIGQPIFATVVITIGLSIFLRGIASVVWSSKFVSLLEPTQLTNDSHRWFNSVSLSTFDIYTVVAAAVFLGAISLFLRFTTLGIQMRAAAENSLLAAERGINVYVCFALAWGLATLGATFAGVLYGLNVRLDPDVGFVGIKALPVMLLGGMDSLLGVVPAALIVALVEGVALRYVDPLLGDVAPMLVMLLVLVTRPWGLFGTKEEIERV